jgi:hypothetical protein
MPRRLNVGALSRVLIGAVIALVALDGCGGDDEPAPAAKAKSARTPAAAIPRELIGAWTRTFTKREVGALEFPTGGYTLKIQDGTMEVYEGPTTDPTKECISQEECVTIELTGSGTTLTVGDTPSCAGSARYSFIVEGDTLTTETVKDDCSLGRPLLFDERTWERAD